MSMCFEAFVAAYGVAIWRSGAWHRGRRFHGGGKCTCALPGVLGGPGSSPQCEGHFHDIVMESARRVTPQVWAPALRVHPASPHLARRNHSVRSGSWLNRIHATKNLRRGPAPGRTASPWTN